MKKIYSLIGAVALTASVFAQSEQIPTGKKFIATPYTKALPTANALAKTATAMAGDTVGYTQMSQGDFLPSFAANWSSGHLYKFGYTTGGWVYGKNGDSLNYCAQGWVNLNNTGLVITKAVFLAVAKGDVGASTSSVTVELWDMAANKAYNTDGAGGYAKNSNGPNTKKSSVTLNWAAIDTTDFSVATFSTPVNIAGDFVIALNTQGLADGDTVGLLCDKVGDAGNLDYAFHRYAVPHGTTAGSWVVSDFLFSSTGSGTLDNDIAMFAVLGAGTAVKEYYNGMKLADIFPNPATDNVNIQYSLEKDSKNVHVVIYDMHGKVVLNETADSQAAGTYTVKFNTSNLEAGSYFYQVRANGAIMTKEFVITK